MDDIEKKAQETLAEAERDLAQEAARPVYGREAAHARIEGMIDSLERSTVRNPDPGPPAYPEKTWTEEEIADAMTESLSREDFGSPGGPDSVFYAIDGPDVGEDRPRIRRVRDNHDLLRIAFDREYRRGYDEGYAAGLAARD